MKLADLCKRRVTQAQKALAENRVITLPHPSDQLWIVTDASVRQRRIDATLYITRDDQLRLAGFFSSKLRKHQVTWLPCEVEALCIVAAVKHFSPFIIQSKVLACVLTDSKPCVQAIDKLCRGEFPVSPHVTSFLSIVSRCQVNVRLKTLSQLISRIEMRLTVMIPNARFALLSSKLETLLLETSRFKMYLVM